MKYELDGDRPDVDDSCFVHPEATIIGDVGIGEQSSVWPHASIRGDSNSIRVGERTSVQDGAVLHTTVQDRCVVGDDVTVGHGAIVHGCEVADEVLVGMGSSVLSGAEVGEQSIIAAGALVTEETEIPPRSVVMGVPGEVVREVTEDDIAYIRENAQVYVDKTERYRFRLEEC